MTLEEVSWIAGIVGGIAAVVALLVGGAIRKSRISQNASIKGNSNSVNQSVRKDEK